MNLITVIARFRAAVLAQEDAAALRLIQAYGPARERLIQQIDALVTAWQAAGTLTATEITRFERAVALAEQVEAEIARLSAIANTEIVAGQQQMVALAGNHARALALVSVPASQVASIASAWNRVPTSAVEALVGRLSDGSPLNGWLAQFGPETSQRVAEALQEGVALGRNPRAVATRLTTEVDISQVRLLNTTRTTMLDSYRSATLASYQENSDLGREWEWISAQDERTCLSCIDNDGKRFPLSVSFQPCHNACRCSSIFVLDGIGTPKRELASDWFASQPAEVQQQMIPKSAYDDFKSGQLQLSDFNTLRTDDRWGDRYQQATVAQAREAAERRAA